MSVDPAPGYHRADDDYADLDEYPARPRRRRRADLYAGVAVVCTILAFYLAWENLFLAPILGITGLVAAVLALRNGGPKLLLIPVILICLVPTGFVLLALLFMLINLGLEFDLNGLSIVDG